MSVKLDGKEVSQKIYDGIKRSQDYAKENKILAIITIGDDEASKVYVAKKKEKAMYCGYKYLHIQFSENIHFFELEQMVKMLNENPDVKGIIIQKPLPSNIERWGVCIDTLIAPEKDIDGFHPMSKFNSCTPQGIITLLDEYEVPYKGKNVVIAGRSKIVAQPLAKMLMDRNCTVTMIHRKTPEATVRKLIENCDVFVSAIGITNYWTEDYFSICDKKIAVVDVGINRITTYNDLGQEKPKLVGDVHPDCYKHFEYYTPVPGGVGLMTVATLITNLSNTKVN